VFLAFSIGLGGDAIEEELLLEKEKRSRILKAGLIVTQKFKP